MKRLVNDSLEDLYQFPMEKVKPIDALHEMAQFVSIPYGKEKPTFSCDIIIYYKYKKVKHTAKEMIMTSLLR